MFVELYDRGKNRITAPVMKPLRYSANAIGGPLAAMIQIDATPLDALRYVGFYVIVKNGNGTPVWWGKVEEVLLDAGKLQIGVSQREIKNRIAVLYYYTDGDGQPVAVETAYAEHTRSIETYGKFEERHSLGEATDAQALAVRDQALLDLALPKPSLRINRSSNGITTLRCIGLWETLKQIYYQNLTGLHQFTANHTTEQVMGWALTSNQIGFADKSIQVLSGNLEAFSENDKLKVTGSLSNDGDKTVYGIGDKPRAYTANTISFDPTDDINDSANGLGFIRSGNYFKVSGSVAHSRWHLADEVARGHISTDEAITGTISAEAAGPAITINQGIKIDILQDVVTELPARTITLTTHGVKVAYSVTIPGTVSWVLGEVWVKMRRVGNPADSVKIEFCANSSGSPGAVLDTVTIPGSSLITRMAWVRFEMNKTLTVAPGTQYWIVISRTGGNSADNYYTVGLDETFGDPGPLRLWTGSAWSARIVNASMPFQLWGHTITTAQILAILNTAQYFRSISVRYTSTAYQRQYRDGSLSAYDEISDLLNVGARLLPQVTSDWNVIIEPAPAQDTKYQIGRDAILKDVYGKPIEEGVLPVGQWCRVDGIADNIDALAPMSPFIIGTLEWNAERGELTDITPLDGANIWDMGGVVQG